MLTLLSPDGIILAAIKFRKRSTGWHVDNVAALDGYVPTVYKVFMQLSGENGVSPCYKPDYSRKEFVVEKSKNIWAKFHDDKDVVVNRIDMSYRDDFLNYNFRLRKDVFNIENSELNLKSFIRKRYIKYLSWFGRIKYKWFRSVEESDLIEFEGRIYRIIQKETHSFLDASVKAHA